MICWMTVLFSGLAVSQGIPDSVCFIRGVVADSSEGTPVPLAIVRIVGESKGTVTSDDGTFALLIPLSGVDLRFSHIGYFPASFRLNPCADTSIRVYLAPRPIRVADVIIQPVDPATRIMSAVIEKIQEEKESSRSYQFRGLTKSLIRIPSAGPAAISVSCALFNGHIAFGERATIAWAKSWLAADSTFRTGGPSWLVDLSKPRFSLWSHSCTGPLSADGLEVYAFSLDSTRFVGGRTRHFIAARLRSRFIPGLEGQFVVDDESDRVLMASLHPNGAFGPSGLVLQLREAELTLVYPENGPRWLPDLARRAETYTVNALGESTALTFEDLLAIDQKTFGIDSLESPLFWTLRAQPAHRQPAVDTLAVMLIPLTNQERRMLVELDTTGRIAPEPDEGRRPWKREPWIPLRSMLQFASFAFTRTTGLGIGARYPVVFSGRQFEVEPSMMYGIADRRMNWFLRFGWREGKGNTSDWSLSAFETIRLSPRQNRFVAIGMVSDILFGEPNAGNFRARGWKIEHAHDHGTTQWSVAFASEEHRKAPVNTSFSVFRRSFLLSFPVPISEGHWQELRSELRSSSLFLSLVAGGRKVSGPGRYLQVLATYADSIEMITDRFALAPVLVWRLNLLESGKGTPAQAYGSPETRTWYYAGTCVFRGMGAMEFAGDRMVTLVLEQNLRGLPFLLVGLGGLHRYGLEFVIHAGVANVAQTSAIQKTEPPYWTSTSGWYTEAGLSVRGVLRIFRLDVTRRFSGPRSTVITFGTSLSFPSLQEEGAQ